MGKDIKRSINPALVFGCMLNCIVLLNSCLGTRKLPPDKLLYYGAIIKIHKDTVIEGRRQISSVLKDNVYPEANSKLLGIPLKLMVFNLMGKAQPGQGVRAFLKYNYGEQPVFMEDVPVEEVRKYLEDLLKANGFLDSHITTEVAILKDKKKRKVIFNCYLNPPYHISSIQNAIRDSAISRVVDENATGALIHVNSRYDLAKLKEERERIDRILKNYGYFYFSPDYIVYKADSTGASKTIGLKMEIKDAVEPRNLRPWFVNNVVIKNKALTDSGLHADTVNIRDVDLVLGNTFRPKAIRPFLLFGKGDLFTYNKYSQSNKNLSSVGAFKFSNMAITPDSEKINNLNIEIGLSPFDRRSLKVDADIETKSNNFAGPSLGITHTNRNWLAGAEQLILKVNGSVEAYLLKKDTSLLGGFNYELETSAELNVPRFLMINAAKFSQQFIPHTHFKIDLRYINQMQYYRMSFFRFNYGYQWSENETKHHELNPVDINFQHLLGGTINFDTLINKNPLLKQSYADQFMFGSSYIYHYALPASNPKILKTAFIGSIELSGNLLYGINLLFGKNKTVGEPLKLFGTVFSQFAKATADYRVYYSTSRNNTLVSRILVGVGIPMGNSSVLPDIKQYYAGGANSIRAFKLRQVGPGGYNDTARIHGILNRTGDIRLEGNIENRFKIARQFEIALFLDAGNIWLYENDPMRPVSRFRFNQFYRQLAVGWGYGLRYLNQMFVIRLDVGNPLYSPIPLNKSPILNFAIGYPF